MIRGPAIHCEFLFSSAQTEPGNGDGYGENINSLCKSKSHGDSKAGALSACSYADDFKENLRPSLRLRCLVSEFGLLLGIFVLCQTLTKGKQSVQLLQSDLLKMNKRLNRDVLAI